MAKSRNRRKKKLPYDPNYKGRNQQQTEENVVVEEGDEVLVDVVEATEHAQDFLERNQKTILGVITALLLLGGAYFAYKYLVKEPKNVAAMEAIHQAQYQFARDSFALALENPGPDAEGFLDIIDNYSGTKVANLAKYYAGVSYLNLGSFDAAIEYLKEFSPADDVTPAMKFGAIGDALSEKGDMSGAISNYKKAASLGDNDLIAPYYLQKLGLLQLKEGDKAAALSAFQSIQSKYPKSDMAKSIEKYIKLASS